jgi:hypothetical protein
LFFFGEIRQGNGFSQDAGTSADSSSSGTISEGFITDIGDEDSFYGYGRPGSNEVVPEGDIVSKNDVSRLIGAPNDVGGTDCGDGRTGLLSGETVENCPEDKGFKEEIVLDETSYRKIK